MEFKPILISVYLKKLVMAHHKKTHTQYENQTAKQDFDNPRHFLISSNTYEQNNRDNFESRPDTEFDNEIFYQYNIDDWQG